MKQLLSEPEWISAVLVGIGMCLSTRMSHECMPEHACTWGCCLDTLWWSPPYLWWWQGVYALWGPGHSMCVCVCTYGLLFPVQR